jgi:alanine dehydrogenase
MPGAVPYTSTAALTTATLPFVLRLANAGVDALRSDAALAGGVNVARGRVTNVGVAQASGRPYTPVGQAL